MVAASVIRPPKELFFVVVTISPARANRAIDKMTKETKISIKVNPFDLVRGNLP